MADISKNSSIRIEEITLNLDQGEDVLEGKIVKILGINRGELVGYAIVKRAIDSRKKDNILLVYSVNVQIKNLKSYFSPQAQSSAVRKKKALRHKIRLQEPYFYEIQEIPSNNVSRPIVVGTGPSGLFCALVLAEAGLRPLVIDRGGDVDARVKDVGRFFSSGKLNINSNVQFGEGGAGTFSDGKLYTNIKNSRMKYVFDEFIKAGAPQRIATDAHPHIGTDKLRGVVKKIREKIISLKGEVRFHTCLTNIEIENQKVAAAIFDGQEKILVDNLILAIGHSARDTYQMLYDKEIGMKPKSFAVGLRIEHPTELINKSQYGHCCNNPKLSTARYKLVAHLKGKRSVYTFCMCPGGFVVASSSEEGGVVTNGMSECAQDGQNSNSALLVNISPDDFESEHPLAGIEFQRKWERKAFVAGGKNYSAPAQRVGDFLKGEPSKASGEVSSTYEPGVKMTLLDECLPYYVIESIKEALPALDRKIKGFAYPDAVLVGVETRSSSPVRFTRDEFFQSTIAGVYPTGEGAGYAGGIVSSAVDGMKVAESIIKKIRGIGPVKKEKE